MYLDGCGSTGESNKSPSSFILNRWTGRLQQIVDATDKAGALRWICMANLTQRTAIKIKKNHCFFFLLDTCLIQNLNYINRPISYLVYQLHNDQLQDVTESMNLIDTCAEVIQSSILQEQMMLLTSA